MPLYRRLPKRGFNKIKNNTNLAIISLSRIESILKKHTNMINDKINLTNLKKFKIINKKYNKLKLLGTGDLNQKLTFEVNSISKSAKAKVEKSGGKVTLIK